MSGQIVTSYFSTLLPLDAYRPPSASPLGAAAGPSDIAEHIGEHLFIQERGASGG